MDSISTNKEVTVKFIITKKEFFWLNIMASLKTIIFFTSLIGVLAAAIVFFYVLEKTINPNIQALRKLLITIISIGAGLEFFYLAGLFLMAWLRVNQMQKTDKAYFEQSTLKINETEAQFIYSESLTTTMPWASYYLKYENKNYMIFSDDVQIQAIKKEGLTQEQIDWIKENQKLQQELAFKKRLEERKKSQEK